jgi:prepilin-type N-terminal cleavage/methylation domain-containing protein
MENHIEIAEETKQDKGFTLVELLIVIVILGILATVTVFAVTGITTRGKDSACKSDLKTIQVAEEAQNANVGDYGTEQQLVDGGLLHAVSNNYDVTPVAAVPDNPATPLVNEAKLESYSITSTNVDCGPLGSAVTG